MIHGTASDTEFTILETLKIMLMEVLKLSDDYDEVVKERIAAAEERAAASEERRAAAAERQAIHTLLDRACSLLTKTSTSGSFTLYQDGVPVHQEGHENTFLAAPTAVNKNCLQNGISIQEENAKGSVVTVNDEASRSNIVESICRKTDESSGSTHSQVEDKSCNIAATNHHDDNTISDRDPSIWQLLVDKQEAMQPASTHMPMSVKQEPACLHTMNQPSCDFHQPEARTTKVDLQCTVLDMLTPPSAEISVQASSIL